MGIRLEVEVLWREGGLTLVDGNCVTVRWGGKEAGDEILHPRNTNRIEGMPVGVSQPKMVKPVPPRRLVCKCGGGRRTVNVLIRGDLPWCVGAVSVGAVAPGGQC